MPCTESVLKAEKFVTQCQCLIYNITSTVPALASWYIYSWAYVVYAGLNHESFICEILFLNKIWQSSKIFNSRKFWAIWYHALHLLEKWYVLGASNLEECTPA